MTQLGLSLSFRSFCGSRFSDWRFSRRRFFRTNSFFHRRWRIFCYRSSFFNYGLHFWSNFFRYWSFFFFNWTSSS